MASPKVAEALSQVAASPEPTALLESILSNIKTLSTPDAVVSDLNAVADALFSASLGIVATRGVLASFINVVRELGNYDMWIAVCTHTLELLNGSGSQASYLDQAATLREMVATAHENNEDFREAARVLAEIPLDSSQRRVSNEEKARVWIRIVRNLLEADDSTGAEPYLNKLKNVMHTITDDRELVLHVKLSQARINDAKREFIAASQTYHEISYSPAIAEEERLHTLSMAIKCAILAPAGPTRSRALGRLYKDERSAGLDEFGILEKMFLDRLLAPEEVEKFAQGLQPHQLAKTADGSTVLARAVVEHNLLSASRLYSNISFDALSVLLSLSGDKAEETTARMIEQGRLVGRIDQIGRLIWFERGEASGEKGSGRAEVVVGKEMKRWDANVQSLAEEVENIANALQREFPDFVAENLAV